MLATIPIAPQEKRPYVQRLFTRIAPRYDWFNRLASLGLDQRWRRRVVREASIHPGSRVLDVCSGTGDLAILSARQLQGNGSVIGADLNRHMLSFAQRKATARHLPIVWCQAEAECLPFADGSFDCVTIGFSTRNLSDLTAGLSEMIRVLRPAGRLIILETGYPRQRLLRFGYQLFLLTVARTIGCVLTGSVWPFTYLARSVRQFLTPEQMIERLQQLQTDVEYLPLSLGLASLYRVTKHA
ncbi:MAG: ubiquinone/menaquinone biosynthesis methyltransferase [Candidatus Omnitrophica bacterium]|nr:ubiquinone/menaquinone biosynthesis methyltransferase [Candidatus Omnitrophota bacterium]